MFEKSQSFELGKNKKSELIVPEFEDPKKLCIATFQGDRPAVSKDETPIVTTGCAMCSALLMRQKNVSILFHVESPGLTLWQRELERSSKRELCRKENRK